MTSTATSLEKKRLRDRRAQHAARARRDTQLRVLQQRLEQRDKSQAQLEVEVQQLRTELAAVRTENAELRRRQSAVIDVLSNCSQDVPLCADGETSHNHCLPDFNQEQLDNSSPCSKWSQLPQNLPEDSLSVSLMPWLLCPAVVTHLSETPCAPDILYGSHANPLSNAIHIALSCALHGTLGDPERLALGKSHVQAYSECCSSELTVVVKVILPTSLLNGGSNLRKSDLIDCQVLCARPNFKRANHIKPSLTAVFGRRCGIISSD